jgi:hypothetical protein
MPRILIVIGDEFMARGRKNHELADNASALYRQDCDVRHTSMVNCASALPFAEESAILENFW